MCLHGYFRTRVTRIRFFRAHFNKSDASNALHLSANYKSAPRTRFVALSPRTRRGSALRALHSAHAPSLSRPTQRLIHTRTLASSLSRLAPYAARRLFGRRTSGYEYLFSASTRPALRVIGRSIRSFAHRTPPGGSSGGVRAATSTCLAPAHTQHSELSVEEFVASQQETPCQDKGSPRKPLGPKYET